MNSNKRDQRRLNPATETATVAPNLQRDPTMVSTLGQILDDQMFSGDIGWFFYGRNVVFVAMQFAWVFDRKDFARARKTLVPARCYTARELVKRCRDYSHTSRGELALAAFEMEVGPRPVIDETVRQSAGFSS